MGSTFRLLICFTSIILQGITKKAPPPQYTYSAGSIGTKDVVLADCAVNQKGSTFVVLDVPVNLTTKVTGTIITYIQVLNNKKKNEQGTVEKTGGGINNWYVSFRLISVEGHGFDFNFKVYGHAAPGKTEPPLLGNCISSNG